MHLYSAAYLEDEAAQDSATIAVEERVWKQLHDEFEGAGRMFLKMDGLGVGPTGQSWYAALGTPVRSVEGLGPEPRAFLPGWMLERVGVSGSGEYVEAEWLPAEAFPEATRIVLRPHDSAFYHADAKEELEAALTRMGVLQMGTDVVIPLACLGGYEITFDVVRTEPANVVLMQGDEVALEFEAALDGAAEAQSGAVPQAPASPVPTQAPEQFDDAAMLPLVAPPPPAPTGHILGGQVRRMPDGRPWNPWRDGAGAKPKVAP